MRGHLRALAVWGSMVLMVAAMGCAEQKKPAPGPGQEPNAAADRINELQSEVNQAKSDLTACQERELALRNENERLKEQLAKGTVATEGGWTSVPGGAMLAIEGTVLFDSGKAHLKGGASRILDGVAKTMLEKYAGYDVYIFGHTDSEQIKKSGWKDNYELSCQRSLTVVRYIQAGGAGNYMAACGWGEHRPAADNATKEAKQANRRVEIYAMNAGAK